MNISDSRELRILRQDNLRFYAEVNARAFCGANMGEIPVVAYLRVIDEVKAESLDQDYPHNARYYLDVMLGKFSSYDRQRNEPWVGTDKRNDTEVVVLLDSAARALHILRDLEPDQSFLAVSSLATLTENITQVVAKLSGDTTRQIAALEERRRRIDADIADLHANGATPLTRRERQTEAYALISNISRIRGGFAQVPIARRRINRENLDLFLESDAPVCEVLDTFWDRTRLWEESGEAAVLATLRDLHVDITRGHALQLQLEAMTELCADLIDPRDRREIASFLPDMLEISSDITIEISNIWKSVHSYISNPNYAARREDARALREARDGALRIRDIVQPSPRDTRLKDAGLTMTESLRLPPQSDIRLTMTPPDEVVIQDDVLPAEIRDGEDPTLELMAVEKARSVHLGDRAIRQRIAAAMGNDDLVTLSDVLRRFPLRYGRHEISRFLTVASSHHPSLLVKGLSFVLRIEERGIVSAANVPNPIFLRRGEVGQGFGDFSTIEDLLHPDELRKMTLGALPIDRDTRPVSFT